MRTRRELPTEADTAVLGGGTAGAAVAGLLAAGSDGSVLVIEAGPDYGPCSTADWPRDLLDARVLPSSHQWGFDSGASYPTRKLPFERARVIGGCSSHNGCAAVWGNRSDYDSWAAAGNPGWSGAELEPLFEEVERRLRVRSPAAHEINPFQGACMEAAAAAGVALVDDFSSLDGGTGIGPFPLNVVDGVRLNTAFAYLDPVRDAPNITVCGDLLVDRLELTNGRVTGVALVTRAGARRTVRVDRVVLAAGTYGSPAVLLRSGVGDPEDLRAAGIELVHELAGVGRNLHDHPAVCLGYAGGETLQRSMRAFGEHNWLPDEQTIAKLRSTDCDGPFDIHVYPYNPVGVDGRGRWELPVACLNPRARGRLRVVDADPGAAPLIDHRYLDDPDGHDRAVLADGIRWAREIAGQEPLATLLGAELGPAFGQASDAGLHRFIDGTCAHYFHPVGTCKMGPASDPDAVVDARGQVHGLDGVYVADASIMPTVPRANTNVPVVVAAERVAASLLGARSPSGASPLVENT